MEPVRLYKRMEKKRATAERESQSLKNFDNPYQIKTQIYQPTLLISLIAMRPKFHFPIFCALTSIRCLSIFDEVSPFLVLDKTAAIIYLACLSTLTFHVEKREHKAHFLLKSQII